MDEAAAQDLVEEVKAQYNLKSVVVAPVDAVKQQHQAEFLVQDLQQPSNPENSPYQNQVSKDVQLKS